MQIAGKPHQTHCPVVQCVCQACMHVCVFLLVATLPQRPLSLHPECSAKCSPCLPSICGGAGGPDSGLHACVQRTLPNGPPSRSQNSFLISNNSQQNHLGCLLCFLLFDSVPKTSFFKCPLKVASTTQTFSWPLLILLVFPLFTFIRVFRQE